MITVERLRLTVPARLGERADQIAWLVADELARVEVDAPVELDRLIVSPVTVSAAASDEEIAARIVDAVRAQLVSSEVAAR
jgi:hypothetical protein